MISRGFAVAPYLAPIYPGFIPAPDPFYSDPEYYDYYYDRWRYLTLPTIEMMQQALPEGVLDTNGGLSGYLYFEKITASARAVSFQMDLTAETGERFGVVSIPLVVKR